MAKINDHMINLLVDTFDKAVLLYYNAKINDKVDNTAITDYNKEKGRLNFYICLIKVIDYFLEDKSLDVDDETIEKITYLFDNFRLSIEEECLNFEEVRQALLLLDIKGFKNCNFDLDMITPDAIGMICAYILPTIIKQKEINLLDGNFGVGNLIFTICGHVEKDIKVTGIENHGLLAQVVTRKINMLDMKANIYHQDALEYLVDGIDVVISDIATYDYENPEYHSPLYDQGIKYFPYLYVEHYLNLPGDKYYIYIINNDFFSQPGGEKVRKLINTKAHIQSLIVLPDSMFINGVSTKSMMIIKKAESHQATQTDIFVLPSINETSKFMNILEEIKRAL